MSMPCLPCIHSGVVALMTSSQFSELSSFLNEITYFRQKARIPMAQPGKLTEALLLKKAKASTLADVRNLSLWGSHLSDISLIAKLPNVETIALSVNEIDSLEPFSHCPKLRELFLRKNRIGAFGELEHLRNLAELRVLWLTDNPVTEEPDYRERTIALLPGLTKLDEIDIAAEERAAAKQRFPARGAPAPAPAPARAPPAAANVVAAIRLLLQSVDAEGLRGLRGEIDRLIGAGMA
jgi:hypothetical protein